MATPLHLQSSFLGMAQDYPRDRMPANTLWNTVDFIPEILGSPLRKRGGWSYASRALGAGTSINGIVFAPFPSGSLNIAVTSTGGVYKFTTGGETLLGTNNNVVQNPVIHRTGSPSLMTVIIPHVLGNVAPSTYDGTTYSGTMAGSPATGMYADVWNDRLLLGNTLANPNRLNFGPIGNSAATWDTTNSWQDMSLPITGIAALKNSILCFHLKSTERLRGTANPTATSVGDLVQDQPFSAGCVDARSIAKYNDTVIFADVRGVYQSDGATIRDLTAIGGMRNYWRNMLVNFSAPSDMISGGIFNDTYIVSFFGGAGAFHDVLCFDLTRQFWYRLSNLPFRCFAPQGDSADETYAGVANLGRVASLSTMLYPDGTLTNDANGTAITPQLETPFYRGFTRVMRRWLPSLALQDWKNIYLDYLLYNGSLSPTLTISYAKDPTASGYTAISPTVAETLNIYGRVRRTLGFNSSGVMFKIAQTIASDDTRIFGLEAEYSARESSRLAQ